MKRYNYKEVTVNNFNIKWLKSVTYKKFRENVIAKNLHYETAKRIYNSVNKKGAAE